jgi:hypothetical protein
MNGHFSKTLPSMVGHLHYKTGILHIYFRSTLGHHRLPRTLRRGGFICFSSSGEGGFTSVGVGGGTSSGGGDSTSRARQAGAATPPRARRAGVAAPPPCLASLMARLMPCACLRKKKLLDSLLGDRRRWCWGFLCAAVDEVLGQPGFILTRERTVRRSITRLGTRVRSGELLATKIMWSQGDA